MGVSSVLAGFVTEIFPPTLTLEGCKLRGFQRYSIIWQAALMKHDTDPMGLGHNKEQCVLPNSTGPEGRINTHLSYKPTWHSAIQLSTAVYITNKVRRSIHILFQFIILTLWMFASRKRHRKLKSSFTYNVIYSSTIWTKFDKPTQYIMNCIHLNTVGLYWLFFTPNLLHITIVKRRKNKHTDLGLLKNTFKQNHFGPERRVTQAAGFRKIHGYGDRLKCMY